MIVPPTPVVPRRSVIPESPIILPLPVLAALNSPVLLKVDRCEFRRTRVRRQIEALCLEWLGRCITRYRSATCLRRRGLGWFRRVLKLSLPGCCRRGLAWFRRSLNLGLPGLSVVVGLAWFRRSLNLGLPGCCSSWAWLVSSLFEPGPAWLLPSWAWLVSSLFEPGLPGCCGRGLGWFRRSLNLGWFACRPRCMRGGRSPFRWRRFFFSCCAPLAANASARLQNNAKSILIVFSFLPSRLLDS